MTPQEWELITELVERGLELDPEARERLVAESNLSPGSFSRAA
jgi:hypothetical protein